MKFNAAWITNIGLILLAGTLFVDKLFSPPNIQAINIFYGVGALMILIGTITYFVRKN